MSTVPEIPDSASSEKSRFARRNYVAFLVEGGLFIGATAFVQPQMLMPKIIDSLHGPVWLISLMPVIMLVGYGIPTLLVSHWIERLDRYWPLLIVTGFFQRLPYLFAGLLLLLGGRQWPELTLVVVAVTPLINGLIGGSSFVAWQHLLIEAIPKNRWSSLFAWRLTLSCVLGVVAGFIVRAVLKEFPDTVGYGILHLLALVFFTASLIAFAFIKEPVPASRPPKPLPTLWDNLRRVPRLFRASPAYGWIVASRFFRTGMVIGVPFLSIYALAKLGLKQDALGYFIIWQMIGSVAGNLIAGYWGDRSGARRPTLVAMLLFLPLAICLPFVANSVGFYLVLAGFGFCFSATDVGMPALVLENCPDQDRTLYLSFAQFLTVPSMILASLLGWWIWTLTGSMADLMIAAIVSVIISAALLVRIDRYHTLFRRVLRLAPLVRREDS